MDNENPVQNAQTLQGAEEMTGLDNPSDLTLSAEDLNVQPQTPPASQPQPQFQEQPNFADQFLASLQEEETALEKTDMDLRSSIASLLPELQGEGQALAQEEQRLGIFNMRKNLQGINNRILSLNAELFQDDVSLAAGISEIKNKPIAMEFIAGETAALEDKARIARAFKVSEINMLNAQTLAMQGNIALAQDQAQKAVDAKYSPIREGIATRQAQLELISPLLEAEDKKQAVNMQRKWDLALRDLDKREAEEKEATQLATQALNAGASQETVSALLTGIKDGTVGLQDVAREVGGVLGMDAKLQRRILEAQLNKIEFENEELQQTIANMGDGNALTLSGKEDFKSGGFAKRMYDSYGKIKELEAKGISVTEGKISKGVQGLKGAVLSPEEKELVVAYRDFISAKLRKESGAAISPEEYKSEAVNIGLLPKDTPETRSSKLQAMENSLSAFVAESKGAFEYLVANDVIGQSITSEMQFADFVRDARTANFKGDDIVNTLKQNLPEFSSYIQQWQDAGYTPEEIALALGKMTEKQETSGFQISTNIPMR